ncbi:MAG TPA: hypothetical protein VLK33_13660 [Terriglobales bacterium]|nr:hypothetical protein [Terriglobales bacterium]
MNKGFATLLIVLTLVFTDLSDAFAYRANSAEIAEAGNAVLIIQNKTTVPVTVNLSGPQNYSFTIDAGTKKRFEILQGHYTYSYTACGSKKTGKFVLDSLGYVITIAKCDKKGGESSECVYYVASKCDTKETKKSTVVFVIQNNTGADLRLGLSGPASYSLYVPTGKTKFTVTKGSYKWTMSGTGCGGISNSGNINLERSIVWTWSCH